MADFSVNLKQLNRLEEFACKNTAVHRIHPMAKLTVTLFFIVAVVSCGRYSFAQTLPYFAYIIILPPLADIPYGILLKRVIPALPFCIFAGISNIILERSTAFSALGVNFSYGTLSFVTILLKTVLTVAAVVILSATTPMRDINMCLSRLRIPSILIMQISMTYRYLCIISDEAHSMYNAYIVRSNGKKGILAMHMGSFLGQLLIRSFDRAERVYLAMKCAGYSGSVRTPETQRAKKSDIFYAAALCVVFWILRFGGAVC